MIVEDGKIVSIHYTLSSDAGEQLDTSIGGQPLAYLHGAGNIVPGLEAALEGRSAGDHVDTVVPPEAGYGPREGEPEAQPRAMFPEGVELAPGVMFTAETADGRKVHLWVDRVEGDLVYIDLNHPLAGYNLHFSVDVVEIRDASDEERSHGHPHGPGGHTH